MKNESLISVAEIDELKLFFRDKLVINDRVIVKQPTIRELKDYGEKEYYSMIYSITSIPSNMKSQLYDFGVDYEAISDFELFILLTRKLNKEQSNIILGDLDLSELEPKKNLTTGDIVLANSEDEVIIDRMIYNTMIQFIRKMHGIMPKVEKASNKFTKKILIDEDRQKIMRNSNKEFTSVLLPMILTAINTEEFKYNSTSILDIGIYELTLSLQQIQKKKSAMALLQGSYSGMVDCSKINKESFNWMFTQKEDK